MLIISVRLQVAPHSRQSKQKISQKRAFSAAQCPPFVFRFSLIFFWITEKEGLLEI